MTNRGGNLPIKVMLALQRATIFLVNLDLPASDTVYWFLAGEKPVRC